ncbi:MAG: IS3 family transposase [Anaerolineaceae bacterium]
MKRIEQPNPGLARMKWIEEGYLASKRSYGYRRIRIWIEQKYGLQINHKAILRLMNKMGIQSVARKRKPYPKWGQIKTLHHCPNQLKQEFFATKPNQNG